MKIIKYTFLQTHLINKFSFFIFHFCVWLKKFAIYLIDLVLMIFIKIIKVPIKLKSQPAGKIRKRVFTRFSHNFDEIYEMLSLPRLDWNEYTWMCENVHEMLLFDCLIKIVYQNMKTQNECKKWMKWKNKGVLVSWSTF